MTPDYRGILFDLDGTLVDSLDLILSSYRHTMSQHLGHAPPDNAWLSTLGQPLRVQLRYFARSDEEREAMFRTYTVHNQANHERLVRPFPGMREAIVALRAHGYRLGVVTSKLRAGTLRELDTCDLADLFEVLVAADDVERPKPDPQPVQLGAQGLGLEPSAILMVGDSVFDLQAGRAAGARTAAALWGPFDRNHLSQARPDHWLENVQALLTLLSVRRAASADG